MVVGSKYRGVLSLWTGQGGLGLHKLTTGAAMIYVRGVGRKILLPRVSWRWHGGHGAPTAPIGGKLARNDR